MLKEKFIRYYIFLFFFAYFCIGLTIYNDYGMSWDELWQRHNNGLKNYAYLFEGDKALSEGNEKYHGPAFELLLIVIEKIFHLKDSRTIYLVRHFVTFLIFFTGVIFFCFLCRHRFDSWKIGLAGSLFLILSPRIFADSFYNSKDIPFLSVFVISNYTLIRYRDNKTYGNILVHALISAFLTDIRIMGIFIPFFTFLLICMDLPADIRSDKAAIKHTFFMLVAYISLWSLFTICFWPILWEGPIYHFIRAVKEMSRYHFTETCLYMGEYVEASELPWHYVPVWMLITTPVLYSFSFFIGLYLFLKSLFRHPLKFFSDRQGRYDFIILLCFFLPLISVIALHSVLYDAWRHMFFIYPAFLLISLKGLADLFQMISSVFKERACHVAKIGLSLIIAASLSGTVHFMIRYHPYQNVYFNILVGRDMSIIKDNFEMDYWGLSYKQALEYILKHDADEYIPVAVENYPGMLNTYFLPPLDRKRIKVVGKASEAKYFLSNYRWHREAYNNLKEFYSIKINGGKIMGIYKLRD